MNEPRLTDDIAIGIDRHGNYRIIGQGRNAQPLIAKVDNLRGNPDFNSIIEAVVIKAPIAVHRRIYGAVEEVAPDPTTFDNLSKLKVAEILAENAKLKSPADIPAGANKPVIARLVADQIDKELADNLKESGQGGEGGEDGKPTE